MLLLRIMISHQKLVLNGFLTSAVADTPLGLPGAALIASFAMVPIARAGITSCIRHGTPTGNAASSRSILSQGSTFFAHELCLTFPPEFLFLFLDLFFSPLFSFLNEVLFPLKKFAWWLVGRIGASRSPSQPVASWAYLGVERACVLYLKLIKLALLVFSHLKVILSLPLVPHEPIGDLLILHF